MSYVYLLTATNGNTYIGSTINLERRLRQHNKEIKGGARATGIKVEQGEQWIRGAYISGFPDWQSALQFEWRWKQISRKLSIKKNPLERRLDALKQLLSLDRPTSKAICYAEWQTPPEIHFETDEAKNYYFLITN